MATYRLTTDAKKDLEEIRHYTKKRWGHRQAQKYLSELRQTLRTLSDMPALGQQRPEIEPNIYSFPHARHVIYYTQTHQGIVAIGVLHVGMVPLLHLEDRDGF